MQFKSLASSVIIAMLGAQLALLLHLPLPWLMGPLLLTAVCRYSGLYLYCPVWCRKAGQWCIGCSLGLYFMPAIVTVLQDTVWLIVAAIAFALWQDWFGSRMLVRFGGVGFKTAWFSSSVGGASEMSTLAERYGAEVDKVASAHSLRVLMVVVSIPFAFQYLGIHGSDASQFTKNTVFDAWGLLALVALTVSSALWFQWRNWINPWVLGPLLAAALLTLNGIHLSAIPPEIQNLSQMFIGWSLGCKFGPDFFKRAPQFLAVVGVCNAIALTASVLVAYALSWVLPVSVPTLILSLAPGGITEMTITAKVLQLGVPIVTTVQVARMVCVLLVTGPLFHWQASGTQQSK
ncbi:AbrB family transcriptional regulator [Vitreoscilla massiliensis]|uniref:AbrB family transcriptional regulator n=1 Tax=Vitreoscilla massiliensis TaxID=1689272 RepID=A0ABY4DZ42_9NEIS|nr:AbrB family transcriptional regulator [Vitreoscilla massiliensis]UOO88348.1 AbrB family transcriptional regulator [Vitreoscilla massiliensis]